MKTIKFAVIFMALVLVQYSCKKDDTDEDTPATKVSVAEGKSIIEKSATDMLNKADAFRSDNAVSELQELSDYLDQNMTQNKSMNKSYSIFRYFVGLGDAVADAKIDVKGLASEQTRTMNSDDLWDDYSEETGVYVWNLSIGDFEKTADSDNIDYSITYTVNGVTKSATFLVSNFSIRNINPDFDQVVKSVDVSFKIGTTEYFNYHLASDYSNYLPTSLSSSLTFGGLSSTVSLSNVGNATLTTETKIILDGTQLLKYKTKTTGDFSMLDNGQDVEEEDVPNVYQTVSAELTILNLVVSSSSQVATIATWMNEHPDAAAQEEADAMNNNTDISITTTNNQIIASAEFYVRLDEWTDSEWDESTQTWIEVPRTDEVVDIRFLFNDGTSSDFETYFGEGFQAVEDQFDSVFDSYEDMAPENL